MWYHNPSQFALVIIPASASSRRLPNKLLLSDTGKPLIQHTYEAASKAKLPEAMMVASDSQDIIDAVKRFGGRCRLTVPANSGTDRIAGVAACDEFRNFDIIVNVQGDEPEIDGEHIDKLIQIMRDLPCLDMATLATRITSKHQYDSPSCVKVVFREAYPRTALYFSRSPIPNNGRAAWTEAYRHIGVYAYRRTRLLEFAATPQTPLEISEDLEQLRALELDYSIAVEIIEKAGSSIDVYSDYQEFVKRVTQVLP